MPEGIFMSCQPRSPQANEPQNISSTWIQRKYIQNFIRTIFYRTPKKMFRKDLDLTRVCESPNLFIICRQIKQFYYKEFYQKWRNNYGDFHIFLFVFFFFLYLNSSFRSLKNHFYMMTILLFYFQPPLRNSERIKGKKFKLNQGKMRKRKKMEKVLFV